MRQRPRDLDATGLLRWRIGIDSVMATDSDHDRNRRDAAPGLAHTAHRPTAARSPTSPTCA